MHRPEPDQAVAEPPPPQPEAEPAPDQPAATWELDDYEELESEEIIALLGSMERRELEALRELESDSRARPSVLHAIDSVLARAPAAG
jgi:hypothetical protein